MRRYNVRVTWQHQGKGYERTEAVEVTAAHVRSAVKKALDLIEGAARRRGTWRERDGGYVKIGVIVGARTPLTTKIKSQDLTCSEGSAHEIET